MRNDNYFKNNNDYSDIPDLTWSVIYFEIFLCAYLESALTALLRQLVNNGCFGLLYPLTSGSDIIVSMGSMYEYEYEYGGHVILMVVVKTHLKASIRQL